MQGVAAAPRDPGDAPAPAHARAYTYAPYSHHPTHRMATTFPAPSLSAGANTSYAASIQHSNEIMDDYELELVLKRMAAHDSMVSEEWMGWDRVSPGAI